MSTTAIGRDGAGEPQPDDRPRLAIPFAEFIALCALLMSMTAMSIDIMLPSLPDIGATLAVADPADLPLVVSVYMFGMAAGQLCWGALSDRLGRRPTLLAGLAIFVAATVVAMLAGSFPQLLAARFTQGLGGSVGRIVVTAIVRDLFAGRHMARVMSMVMTVFILVPILAPAVGQGVILWASWRWVFGVLLAAGVTAMLWLTLRLPETRARPAPGARPHTLGEGFRIVAASRVTVGYGVASGFMFGVLVSYIASAQQIFGGAYGLGRLFPLAFGGVACFIAGASFTNARLVQRLGMRRLSHTALVAFLAVSSLLALATALAGMPLSGAIAGTGVCFFLYGLILANFNAIAMQPVGAAAGMAASLTGSWTTVVGASLGTVIARSFDGTILPLFTGFALLTLSALVTVLAVEGRRGLFHGE